MEITSAQQHHRQMMSPHHPLEELLTCPNTNHQPLPQFQPNLQQQLQIQLQQQQQQEKKPRPNPDQALKCPRCDSTNTKFCYYNNYSLSQPRYFCKSCRRYWTQGGSLRNVPVGGGCRKNRRPSSSSASSSSSSSMAAAAASNTASPCKKPQEAATAAAQQFIPANSAALIPASLLAATPLSLLGYDPPSDLSLAFAGLQKTVVPVGKAGGVLDLDGEPEALYLGNGGAGHGFLDILKSSVPAAFHGSYYGFGNAGNDAGVVPFDVNAAGSNGNVELSNTQHLSDDNSSSNNGGNKLPMGLQWQQLTGVGGDAAAGAVLDAGRDYWSNGVGSWHGIINSSLM